MVPIRDENGDVRLISFEEYRQWLRTDPSEKGQHPINNPEWTVTEDLWLDEEEQRILEYIKRTIPAEEVEHCLQVRKDIALRGAWSHRELDARLDRMQAEAQKVYEDNEPHNDPQQHTGGSGQQTSVEDIEHGEEPEAGNPDRQPQSGGYEPHNDPQQQSGGSEAPSAHAPKTAMQWLEDASRSLPHPLQLMPPESMPVASIASRFPHPPKQAPPTSPPVTKAASSSPHPGTVGARSPAVASNYGYEPQDTPWVPAISTESSPPPVPEGTEDMSEIFAGVGYEVTLGTYVSLLTFVSG